MDVEKFLKESVREAIDDGIGIGFNAAIDTLEKAKPEVDSANQTWDSAIAILKLMKAKIASDTAS